MTFIFKDYGYDKSEDTAWFVYEHTNGHAFRETIRFDHAHDSYDEELLERALFLSFLIVGTSYWKCFPTQHVEIKKGAIDDWQASFLNKVYQEGMSQFAFENKLERKDLAHFNLVDGEVMRAMPYSGDGVLALQSGGKDSLLLAQLLDQKRSTYTPWYISSGSTHPVVLDQLAEPLQTARRTLDHSGLSNAHAAGAKNGHVPVTYIVLSYAVIQAILCNKNIVLAAVAHEGDEPHGWIKDLPINHQWSKTWDAELLFAEYVKRHVSSDLRVGSPLRAFSELKIAELFVEDAWERFGGSFSSCNTANYQQGINNTKLAWCGHCPKCANSYLLFAPFAEKRTLDGLLGGDLFARLDLVGIFKGLLDVDDFMKPFECVGEVDELRMAYQLGRQRGYSQLPFNVPVSKFDIDQQYDAQVWASAMLQ